MELVKAAAISDFTKATLEQFGWKLGDAIPAALGAYLLEIKNTIPASTRTDVLIDANLMPEDAIEKVKNMLKEAKDFAAKKDKQAALDSATANMAPSVAEAYKKMVADEDGPQIIDDRGEEEEENSTTQDDNSEQEQTADAGEEERSSAFDPLAPPVILPFCQRCGWDMRNKFDVKVTDKDKHDFVISILGGTRFKRDFPLMGGKLVITFRSMLAEENNLVHRQLILDQQNKEIVTEPEWFLRFFEYRLACSLESLSDDDGKKIAIVPELSEFPFQPPPDNPLQTPINQLLQYVNKTVLPHEVTRRLVGTHLRQFQRLVEALEAMALDPSFWEGIEK